MVSLGVLPSPGGGAAAAPIEDTVDLVVKVGGTALGGEDAVRLLDVSVAKTVGEAAQLTLHVAAWDSDSEELRWVDDDLFAPGATIEVELGYLDRRVLVFHGDVVSLSLEASTTARAVLTVTAYDILHRLGRGQRSDRYNDKSYAGIVRQIAEQIYHLEVDAPDHPDVDPQRRSVLQQNKSDLELIRELAEEIGYEVFAEGPKLVFRKSSQGGAAQLTLDAGRELTQFSAHLSAASQLGGVAVRILDSESKETIEVEEDNADAADEHFRSDRTRTLIVEDPLTSQEQARARARAEQARMRSSFLDATGTCLGRTDLKAGMMIQIDNLGRRFGGAYYVTAVTHSLSSGGGLRTSFSLKGQPR